MRITSNTHWEVRQCAEGIGGSQQQQQPPSRLGVRNSSQLSPNQRHIHLVEVKYCEDTSLGASLKPLTTSTAYSVNIFAELRPMRASTLTFWEWEVYSPYSLEPLKHLGLDPQKVIKLAVKLHAHLLFGSICL